VSAAVDSPPMQHGVGGLQGVLTRLESTEQKGTSIPISLRSDLPTSALVVWLWSNLPRFSEPVHWILRRSLQSHHAFALALALALAVVRLILSATLGQ
jgi:hypothetical protein